MVARTLLPSLVAVVACATALPAQPTRTQRINQWAGAAPTRINGSLTGRETIDYVVPAAAGQSLRVELTAGSTSAYFDVTAPGAESAMFYGSSSGARFEGKVPASGDYTVRVHLVPSAARRGTSTRYTITFAVAGAGASSSTR